MSLDPGDRFLPITVPGFVEGDFVVQAGHAASRRPEPSLKTVGIPWVVTVY
jgi:hypothetical protein